MGHSKKVLLINPMENFPKPFEMYPSGALILLGTLLIERGHDVKVIHMVADGVGLFELSNILSSFKPDVVGITMNTFQTKSVKEISELIKDVSGDILVVVGGPHPSALKLKIFDDFPHVDIAVIGEGEFTFLEIVESEDFENIRGICHKGKMNESRPLAGNLDHIPLPNLDLVDINKFVGVEPVGARPTMFIMASRGCPFQCTFCNKSVWGNKVRFRKPESIIEEIKWLHERYGVREIFFQDDTFNLSRKWAEKVLNFIIDNGLNRGTIYKTPFRANEKLVDKELLQLAKDAGFWLIFYGVENGNQQMLDRMKKGLTVEEIKRAFELTHKVGLKTIGSFIIGLPGESKKTIEDTANLWKEINPSWAGYSFAIPFPETEFHKIVTKKGHLLISDYDKYSLDRCVVRTDDLTKEELEYYRGAVVDKIGKMRLRYNLLRPRYIGEIIINSFKNPRSIFRRARKLYKLLFGERELASKG